nr:triacylglycerol lipase [Eubacterium sp.]
MGKTKYPILFVHGMGFRDRKIFSYWGRIPKRLKSEGYVIYFGEQDANGTIEQNGKYIAKKIEKILENETDDKVNIIAHSKGGLDARYAICNCNVSDKVASLTTIGTPHHGSKSINILLKFPVCLIKFFCLIADIILKVLGDGKPNTYAVIKSFSTDYMTEF